VLETLAAELGLDDADASISGDLYGEEVDRATAEAHALGINAIPAYLLDHRLIVLGAQPDHVFDQAIERLERANASADE
jgi:predicted DsbA family dithiol-disulfide isomerase